MKVALCFSGAIRSFDTCIPSIKRYFINPLLEKGYEVDIFIYMVYLKEIDSSMNVTFKMRKTNSSIDKLLKVLQPKKYDIREYNNKYQKLEMTIDNIDYREFDFRKYVKNINWKKKDTDSVNNYAYNSFGMYYKIYKCNELKSLYEKENNFTYDFVWRCRLDYIYLDKLNYKIVDNTIYMIEDRYATNTRGKLKYTNDKFIGAPSKIMDKICDLYIDLPIYIKQGIQLDGATLIQTHMTKLIFDNNYQFKMIGHENTYYKCQGRHEIRLSDKIIFVDLKDKKLLFEICYKLLYLNFTVISTLNNEILKLFSGYSMSMRDLYYGVICDYKNNYSSKIKKIYLNVFNTDGINIKYTKTNKLFDYILYSLTYDSKNCNFDNISHELKVNQRIRFIIPDRGYYNGIINSVSDDYCIIKHCNKQYNVKKDYIQIIDYKLNTA